MHPRLICELGIQARVPGGGPCLLSSRRACPWPMPPSSDAWWSFSLATPIALSVLWSGGGALRAAAAGCAFLFCSSGKTLSRCGGGAAPAARVSRAWASLRGGLYGRIQNAQPTLSWCEPLSRGPVNSPGPPCSRGDSGECPGAWSQNATMCVVDFSTGGVAQLGGQYQPNLGNSWAEASLLSETCIWIWTLASCPLNEKGRSLFH